MEIIEAAAVAGIAASLATKRTESEKLDRFHALIRTPIAKDEVLEKPCHLPTNVSPAERPSFFVGSEFEFPKPSRESIVGFALSCVAVVAMIGSFLWLMS